MGILKELLIFGAGPGVRWAGDAVARLGFAAPDLRGVVRDGAVGAEFSSRRDVVDALLSPRFLVLKML